MSVFLLVLLGFVGGLGTLFLAMGILGSLSRRQMKSEVRFALRHAVAIGSTLVVYVGFSVLMWFLSAINDATLTGFGILGTSFVCLPIVGLLVTVTLFPISAVIEWLLIDRLGWRWWRHVPATAMGFWTLWSATIFLLLPVLLGRFVDREMAEPYFSLNERAQIALYYGALLAFLFGVVYWLALRTINLLMSVLVETGGVGRLSRNQPPNKSLEPTH